MRILLLSNMYPSHKRPVCGVFVFNQVRELEDKHGIDMKLVVSDKLPQSFSGKVLKYLRLHLLAWTAAFTRFDGAHLHYASSAHLLAAAPALLIRRKPVVITLHRGELYTLPNHRLGRNFVRYFLNRADALIPVSNDLKRKLTHEFRLPSEKMFVIDVGCDLSVFSPCLPNEKEKAKRALGLPVDKFTALFVGNISHRKGLDILFDALDNFDDSFELLVLIIGDGPAREELENLVVSQAVRYRVDWLGEKKNHELPQWYAAADVFLLPSRSEGTPTVMLEAMASGTPVIASRVGGIPDVITDGVTGLLFESENREQLRLSLQKLLHDQPLREQLARNALDEIGHHSLQRQVERIKDIYQSNTSTSKNKPRSLSEYY